MGRFTELIHERLIFMKGYLFPVVLSIVLSGTARGQAVSEEWLKSEYLILLSGYISWENEEEIDTFDIGVFADEPVYTQLSFKSETQTLKKRPFRVRYYKRQNKIKQVHILYIGERKNPSMRRIWNRWRGNPVLFVTDSSRYEYTMINLLAMNLGGKPFEINKTNIDVAGLSVSPRIIAVGGKEEDIRTIYLESERELEQLKSDIAELNEDLQEKQAELDKSMEDLRNRTREINSLNEEIRRQRVELQSLSEDIQRKQKDLNEKIGLLQEQENEIASREKEIEKLNTEIVSRGKEIQVRSETMAEQQKSIREQRILMNEQQAVLNKQRIRIEWQKNALIFFIALSLLILMLGFFIYRAYRIKIRVNRILQEKNRIIRDQNAAITRQKEEISAQRDQLKKVNTEIEKQNENITSSIYYALTIQQAILPDESEINKFFRTFIIYYPKDIVSGDFYWFTYLGKRKSGEETSFFAVVDCTGHGVPGGFLSMVGARMLSAIINEGKVYETDRILEMMDQRLRLALKQHKTQNDDGMDISLCRIVKISEERNRKPGYYASFSGARQHTYLVRNQHPVEVIRASRRTIGGKHFNPEPFSKHELALETGDQIYFSTDGLIDQNSPERIRYGSPRLIEFINENNKLPMEEQKRRLEEEMIGFMKTEKQRDDITIMGIKL